jgi:peptide/nickel transport system ATP-binding protein
MNAPSGAPASAPLLKLDDVRVTLDNGVKRLPLIREATFQIRPGEIVCLVGESGSGKSVTARTIMGLLQQDDDIHVDGSIVFDGTDIAAGGKTSAGLRGRDIAMVFQEPLSSLDPVFTIETQLTEALRRLGPRKSKKADREQLVELLAKVGIHDGPRVLRSYPHQLSGGMCQRVMIAQALAAKPKLLIADEPTTALDVTIQAQILSLIEELRDETDMSVLLVTHDMGVAAELADRVVVMYAGRVVEDAAPAEVFTAAHHPYTSGLLSCIPPLTGEKPERLPAIEGSVPDPSNLPTGCSFHPRCPFATDECAAEVPERRRMGSGYASCFNPLNLEPAAAGAR